MKKPLCLLSILCLMLWGTACQSEQFDDLDRLELSTTSSLQAPSESTELIVGVETNFSKWSATTQATWLTVKPVGNNLVLLMEPNETIDTRTAVVVVTAGGLTKKLKIEQAGQQGLVLEIAGVEGELLFPKAAAEYRYSVKSNTSTWTVSSDASWLTATAIPTTGVLTLRLSANESLQRRTANLTVSAKDKTLTIKVAQEGKLNYILPYSLWGKNLTDVEELETARGSVRLDVPNANKGIPYYVFTTQSAAFPRVRYEFLDYGMGFLYATVLEAISPTTIYSVEFLQYLTEQGFERITDPSVTSGVIEYRHTEQKIKLYLNSHKLTNDATTETGMVYLIPLHQQPKALPTLPTFDQGLVDFKIATESDVQAWESNHGGYYDAEFSGIIGLPFWFVDSPFYGRGYFFQNGTAGADGVVPRIMVEKIHFYYDVSQLLYFYGDICYPTAEFLALVQSAGYELRLYDPVRRRYTFYNPTSGLAFVLNKIKLDKVYGMMNIWRASNGTSSYRADLRDLIEPISLADPGSVQGHLRSWIHEAKAVK